MKIAALITAKSQSLRVPKKNFRLLGGIPLYRHSVCFVNDNRDLFNGTVFSSDKPESFAIPSTIMSVKRPPELCFEESPHLEIVKHALSNAELYGARYDDVLLFQPTNPIR